MGKSGIPIFPDTSSRDSSRMWKKVVQALGSGATAEEDERETTGLEGIDRMNIEIVSIKGSTEELCQLMSWIVVSYQVNGKYEMIQTKRMKAQEDCYYDNNNWWIYTGLLVI